MHPQEHTSAHADDVITPPPHTAYWMPGTLITLNPKAPPLPLYSRRPPVQIEHLCVKFVLPEQLSALFLFIRRVRCRYWICDTFVCAMHSAAHILWTKLLLVFCFHKDLVFLMFVL